MEVLIPVFKEVWKDFPLQQSRKLSSFRNSNDNNREPDIKVVRYGWTHKKEEEQMKELKASARREKADDMVIKPETGRDRGCGPGCVRGTETPAESQDATLTAGPVKGARSLFLPRVGGWGGGKSPIRIQSPLPALGNWSWVGDNPRVPGVGGRQVKAKANQLR